MVVSILYALVNGILRHVSHSKRIYYGTCIVYNTQHESVISASNRVERYPRVRASCCFLAKGGYVVSVFTFSTWLGEVRLGVMQTFIDNPVASTLELVLRSN